MYVDCRWHSLFPFYRPLSSFLSHPRDTAKDERLNRISHCAYIYLSLGFKLQDKRPSDLPGWGSDRTFRGAISQSVLLPFAACDRTQGDNRRRKGKAQRDSLPIPSYVPFEERTEWNAAGVGNKTNARTCAGPALLRNLLGISTLHYPWPLR